jgi:hypothetical protein
MTSPQPSAYSIYSSRNYGDRYKSFYQDLSKEVIGMTNGLEFSKACRYQIRVKGMLDSKWSDWFDGLTITPEGVEDTLLDGQVADQATLHGLLAKIRDLGLPLLSLERLEEKTEEDGTLP